MGEINNREIGVVKKKLKWISLIGQPTIPNPTTQNSKMTCYSPDQIVLFTQLNNLTFAAAEEFITNWLRTNNDIRPTEFFTFTGENIFDNFKRHCVATIEDGEEDWITNIGFEDVLDDVVFQHCEFDDELNASFS